MVIGGLVEGSSIRSIEWQTGIHCDTIVRLLASVGNACERLMDSTTKNLICTNIQIDEIWSFVGKKQRHVTKDDNPNAIGDFYTFVSIDSETN